MPRENQIQRRIVRRLRAHGWLVWKADADSDNTDDLVCCSPSAVWWVISVKKPGEKPTPLQQVVLDDIASRGGNVMVAHSSQDVSPLLG